MPILQNQKHEAYAQALIAGKTREEAYAEAGFKPNRSHAARLATSGSVKARLQELQATLAEQYVCTAESMAAEFDRAIAAAYKLDQIGAVMQGLNSKAKLFGLMVEKQNVSVTHSYSLMSDEEILFEMTALIAESRQIEPGIKN